MSDYFQVAQHLAVVRRAWKRAAALAGLAIVCIESIGILIVALLLDWVYQPAPAVRVGLFIAVLVLIAALAVRHILTPLFKKISDDQLALFVEEHSDQFEGALITAAELNSRHNQAKAPQAIVDAVMQAAAFRAGRTNIRAAVDLRRLRKYALAAIIVMAGYGAVCLAFPETIGRHASRVMAPWKKRSEDLPNRAQLANAQKLPVEFTLSKGDSRLLRRQTFDLQATLSHASGEPVLLNFRPAGQQNQPWRALPMKEIEKLNTFAGAVGDIDEDLEFCVSTGSDRSPTFKIGVYDPLRITGFQVTTHYPAYLKLPDRTENMSSGDLMAPAGSTVKMRILAGSPLTSGKITWQDGRQQPMTIENTDAGCAIASFPVTQDTTYSYAVSDANGQTEQAPVPSSIRALPDNPPKIEVKYPLGMITANPLGEITFAAEATDDLALDKVELVYQRQLPMNAAGETPPLGPPVRLSMYLTRATPQDPAAPLPFPDVAQASVRFALEDLQPAVAAEEMFSYYFECTDRKGQVVVTDIQAIVIDRFDTWPTFMATPPEEPHYLTEKNITDYIQAIWKLEQQKPTLKADEFLTQSKAIAASMIDPETKRMYSFYKRKKVPPEKIAHADRIDRFLDTGYRALLSGNTEKALSDFRVVLAELVILKLDKNGVEMFAADYSKKGSPKEFEKDLKNLFSQIKLAVPDNPPPADWDPKEAKPTEKLRKAAQDLAKQQAEVVKKAEEIAQAGTGSPKDNKDEDKDKQKTKDKAAKDAKELANKQDKVAAEAQKAGMQDPADAQKDPTAKEMAKRIADATNAMRDASRNMKDNKMEQAVADAKRAQTELKKVADHLEGLRQEKLAAAVAEAEARATKLLKDQKDLTKETDVVAKKDGKTPEAQKDTDYKKLTYKQAKLQAETAQFKKDVEDLKNAAQRDAKAETAKHLDDTHKEMTRNDPDQKMTNAVVELQAKHGKEANKEQADAEKGLEKVVAALRKADESLAADRESQLARAKAEAKRIKEGLAKLDPNAAATQPSTQKAPATQPALATNDKKGPGKDPATQPATQSTAKTNDKHPDSDKPLTAQEKKDLAENIAAEMERLARHLADRDFADKPDQQYLAGASKDQNRLTDDLLNDKKKKTEIITIVRRVQDKLEAEYQVTLESKRLQDAQREDCPPQYRQLVNKYYQALSEAAK